AHRAHRGHRRRLRRHDVGPRVPQGAAPRGGVRRDRALHVLAVRPPDRSAVPGPDRGVQEDRGGSRPLHPPLGGTTMKTWASATWAATAALLAAPMVGAQQPEQKQAQPQVIVPPPPPPGPARYTTGPGGPLIKPGTPAPAGGTPGVTLS